MKVEYQEPFRLPNAVKVETSGGEQHLADEASFELRVPPEKLAEYIHTAGALFKVLEQRCINDDDAWETAMTHDLRLMTICINEDEVLPHTEGRSAVSTEIQMRLLDAELLAVVAHKERDGSEQLAWLQRVFDKSSENAIRKMVDGCSVLLWGDPALCSTWKWHDFPGKGSCFYPQKRSELTLDQLVAAKDIAWIVVGPAVYEHGGERGEDEFRLKIKAAKVLHARLLRALFVPTEDPWLVEVVSATMTDRESITELEEMAILRALANELMRISQALLKVAIAVDDAPEAVKDFMTCLKACLPTNEPTHQALCCMVAHMANVGLFCRSLWLLKAAGSLPRARLKAMLNLLTWEVSPGNAFHPTDTCPAVNGASLKSYAQGTWKEAKTGNERLGWEKMQAWQSKCSITVAQLVILDKLLTTIRRRWSRPAESAANAQHLLLQDGVQRALLLAIHSVLYMHDRLLFQTVWAAARV